MKAAHMEHQMRWGTVLPATVPPCLHYAWLQSRLTQVSVTQYPPPTVQEINLAKPPTLKDCGTMLPRLAATCDFGQNRAHKPCNPVETRLNLLHNLSNRHFLTRCMVVPEIPSRQSQGPPAGTGVAEAASAQPYVAQASKLLDLPAGKQLL